MDKSIVKTVKTLSLSVFPSWGGCMYKSLKTAALSLALTLCIAAPVMAEVPVPTLDRVKSEQTTFLNSAHSSYALTELTDGTAAPEGSITVKIAEKTYYYTPSENTEVLKTLASTGSAALVETTKDKALYTVGEKYYTYNTEKLKDSGYSLKEATSADEPNTITLYDKETVKKYYDPKTGKEVAAGDRQPDIEYREVQTIQTSPKYYTVELKQTEYGYSEIKDDTKTFTVTTPDAEGSGKAFEYTVNYYVDDDRLANDRITTNQNGADIDKDFVGLKKEVTSGNARGGAVYNYSNSTIGNITGDFIGNYASSTGSSANGGAIYNNYSSTIGNITGDFIGNHAYSTDYGAYGGAVYNYSNSTIGNITGDFIGNYASSTGSYAEGGAVYNYSNSTIGNITGDFIGNYASSTGSSANGGAIYNSSSTIGDITGDFIGNYASSTSSYNVYGGAIYNSRSTIGDITGDFIGNYASSTSSSNVHGGAIYNNGTISNITGDFISNYTISPGYQAKGGAIYNNGTISNITGDFIGNYTSGFYAQGGAIYNSGTIGDITGDFIENYATGSRAYGGAIYNSSSTIGDITGDFIGNYASSTGSNAYGGAIYNERGTIGNITGDFIGNYASSTSYYAWGGAIYNDGTIGDITGDFIGNYASSTDYDAYGGAIYNYGTIGNITGDFIGNYVSSSSSSYARGGAIYNCVGSTIGDITGDFIGNYASGSSAGGGAIYNYSNSTIGNITGDFIGNYASSTSYYTYGGAIHNFGTIGNITGDFIGNYASSTSDYARGGAIYNSRTIGNITGDFIGNYAQGSTSAIGGAVMNLGSIMGYNVPGDKMLNISALKLTNPNTGESFVVYYISNDLKQEINAKLEQGYKIVCNQIPYPIPPEQWQAFEEELKAAIEAGEMTTEFPFGDEALAKETGSFINSSFLNNVAEAKNGSAAGGAIFSTNKIHIVADSGQSVFSGNKTISGETEEQNAIGMYGIYLSEEAAAQIGTQAGFIDMTTGATSDKNPASLKLEAKNNGVILFDDTIRGGAIDYAVMSNEGRFEFIETPETAFDLTITGDTTGKVILNNDVINANISLDKTNLYLGRENVFDRSQSLTLNSGSIYLNNNTIGTMHIPTLNLKGNTNLSVDADLAAKTMDRITADTYNITNNAMLNVNNITLLSDAKEDKTNISFADKDLANNVAYTGASPIAYSPIYKYQVSYHPETGEFMFLRGATTTPGGDIIPPANPSDAFNPSVLAPAVATQAGAYTTQLQTFNYAFQHSDNFMNIPYLERVAIIEKNKYALSPTGDATDVGTFSPLLTKEEDAGFWIKPYASFENIPLKNGPKVSNINYGTLIGYDSNLTHIKNGWERVLTGYVGYNGASQRYSGIDAYQNGGLIGTTATFYKGNFFNATTLSVGASVGDATTMYGSENYTMLLAGIGNKTGYNIEFFDGRMILQPNFLISYTFVNTFDYTNSAGVRISSDPLNAIQLSPGIKLIGNTKTGWQPYIGVNMVWNLLDDSKVYANDIRLPEMSIKPYVQYGVGLQKRFKDRFLAFGQAMIHNGGRNGISFSFGIRWKVGKD